MKKGLFITFEGGEGSGKSTHSGLLCKYLTQNGYRVIYTREPGGTAVAESIRQLLLNPESRITPLAELLLYEAARAQHIAEVIMPALKAGCIVICDRYTDATLAYQGYGRGIDLATIRELNTIASSHIAPRVTIYLDIPAEDGLKKARRLAKGTFTSGDRLERETLSFHKKVRQGYRALARKEPKRIKVIRIAGTVEETQRRVRAIIAPWLPGRKKESHVI